METSTDKPIPNFRKDFIFSYYFIFPVLTLFLIESENRL